MRDLTDLRFAPHLMVTPLPGRGVVVIGEERCEIFSGARYAGAAALVSRPDGEEAAEATADLKLAMALDELVQAGVVVRAHADARRAGADWWASRGNAGRSAAPVTVRALGGADGGPLVDALRAWGIEVVDGAGFMVVLTDDYLHPALAGINDDAIGAGRSWMLVNPHAGQILIGPVFVPDHGACWACLAERLRRRRSFEERLARGDDPPATPPSPPTAIRSPDALVAAGCGLAAAVIARWLAGGDPSLSETILGFDPRFWATTRHYVVWRPQCPVCGAGDAPLDRPAGRIALRPRAELHSMNRSLRGTDPAVTFERLAHHISPVSGAVPIFFKRRGPPGLHVYTSGGPAAVVHGDASGWDVIAGGFSGGKGPTDDAARASALGEALERYSGAFQGDEPRRRRTWSELGEAAIEPNACMLFSDAQFEQRERTNPRSPSMRTYVPERLDPEMAIDWSPAWSLTRDRERLLPTALCYYGRGVAGANACLADSSGCAAGNTLEEAILHGLLELIERDHVALWWYNRLAAPRIDLDRLDGGWLTDVRQLVSDQGRELWALDLTADFGVPVVAVLSGSQDGDRLAAGFGAHLELGSAVTRAATELVQLGLGGESGGLGVGGIHALTLTHEPWLTGTEPCAVPSVSWFDADLRTAVELCVSALEGAGLEVVVLDQTRPDIGLPVVKVFAPGIRHFWPRFGPGRLYDVPVSLGVIDRPTAPEALNPVPPIA